MAADLRPEIMYGQTNCWIHPERKYVAFENAEGEILICNKRSSLNMAHQGFTAVHGKLDILQTLMGRDIIGLKIDAPLVSAAIYTLPLCTLDENKGQRGIAITSLCSLTIDSN